ncbi:hypothetical protein [Mycobacterium uberis]|uniref:hypothetical protein n=1 Tax=Mycobacterium uberis TaxID=2162698 RepID=UPI0014033307|nr:hypothetical protein [Mycobacterium uberis]
MPGIPVLLGRVFNAIPTLSAPMIVLLMSSSCTVLHGFARATLPAEDLSHQLGLSL